MHWGESLYTNMVSDILPDFILLSDFLLNIVAPHKVFAWTERYINFRHFLFPDARGGIGTLDFVLWIKCSTTELPPLANRGVDLIKIFWSKFTYCIL